MENQFVFSKAQKSKSKLRLAIDGPAGAGKTYTALICASAIAESEGKRIAFIDSERGSASLYADKFDFDVLNLESFSPRNYTNAIHAAEDAGYGVIVIDSLSHAWEGEGGALDMVDRAAKREQGNSNRFVGWRDVTPLQREMVDAMLMSPVHIVATMRSKMEYVLEPGGPGEKAKVRKVGMAPIQRQGLEFEFTMVGDMDTDHNFIVSKTRIDVMTDEIMKFPDKRFFLRIVEWLHSGADDYAPNRITVDPVKQAPAPAQNIPATTPRPYQPDALKARLAEIAEKMPATPVPYEEVEYLGGLIQAYLPEDKALRDASLFLFGEEDLQGLAALLRNNEIHALKKWLNVGADGSLSDIVKTEIGLLGSALPVAPKNAVV